MKIRRVYETSMHDRGMGVTPPYRACVLHRDTTKTQPRLTANAKANTNILAEPYAGPAGLPAGSE